ncbi:MAG: signal peptidase I [bacterium]|nr:signal peptidase I [bacterium]
MIRRDRDLVPNRKSGTDRSQWIQGALIALVVAFFVRLAVHALIVFPLSISSPDMEPTYPAGSSPYFLQIFDPAGLTRGDVVLLTHPEHPDQHMIRRIAALPGEQVQIHARRLFVNNKPLESEWERRIAAELRYPGEPLHSGSLRRDFAGPVIVPDGQIYVLADNRVHALDSRQLGPLPLESVQAVLWK